MILLGYVAAASNTRKLEQCRLHLKGARLVSQHQCIDSRCSRNALAETCSTGHSYAIGQQAAAAAW